jgi:hypothetical protein
MVLRMKIELRTVVLAVALIAVNLALAIRARKVYYEVEYAGDAQHQLMEQVEAVLPCMLISLLTVFLAFVIVRSWNRKTHKHS